MSAKMYFIAIATPPTINKDVLQWKEFMQGKFGCQVALRSPAHITLVSPFWMDESLEEELNRTSDAFASAKIPFEIQIKNFDAFKPRVIFSHVEPSPMLNDLKLSLESYLAEKNKFGIEVDDRVFHPHITIANRDLRKKDFNEAFEHFKSRPYQNSFSAEAVSVLKHDGSRWQIIHNSSLA